MMRKIIDGVGYYLSCMVPYHLIYMFVILGGVDCVHPLWKVWPGLITFILNCFALVCGILSTFFICFSDDGNENDVTAGIQIQVETVKDLTGENYFANFSHNYSH